MIINLFFCLIGKFVEDELNLKETFLHQRTSAHGGKNSYTAVVP